MKRVVEAWVQRRRRSARPFVFRVDRPRRIDPVINYFGDRRAPAPVLGSRATQQRQPRVREGPDEDRPTAGPGSVARMLNSVLTGTIRSNPTQHSDLEVSSVQFRHNTAT
jgi:hypothetical protein